MKTYNQFLNEGIRDKMTPKSKEDIEKALGKLKPYDLIVKASEIGNLDLVKKAVESGEEVGLNRFVNRPVDYAVNNGHYDVAKYLIDMGTNINYNDGHVLRQACYYGYIDIVRLLLDRGANIHVLRDYPLESAIKEKHKDLVRLLLDRGADLNKLSKTMLDKYNQLFEGIRDMMTPRPAEEVKKIILEKPGLYLKKYKEFLNKEEIYDLVSKMEKSDRVKAILFDVPELYSNTDKRNAINELSKDVRHEMVLGRFHDLYNEEEIEEFWKDLVIDTFERAYKNGRISVNLDWIGSRWTKYSKPFAMNDETYLYKGKKMKIESISSGDWYAHYLTVVK